MIPVYRSASTLVELTNRLIHVLENGFDDFEILFVVDGSPDHSFSVLTKIHQEFPHCINVILFTKNYGQQNALSCGLRHSKGQLVVSMDDDLQTHPEDIPLLVDHLKAHQYDVVFAVADKKKQPFLKNLLATMFHYLVDLKLLNNKTPSSFRILKREIVELVVNRPNFSPSLEPSILEVTENVGSIQVAHHERPQGFSGYSIKRMLGVAFTAIFNASEFPIKIIHLFSFFVLGGSFLFLFFGSSEVSLTVKFLLIIAGIQIFCMGILGEYLARIHLNLIKKPEYSVKSILKASSKEKRAEI